DECKAFYTTDGVLRVDPSNGYEMTSDGYLVEFADKSITVEKMIDYADVDLHWYVPSISAINFMTFIRLCLGEEPENSNPKSHYFFMDCIFQQCNVEPYFRVRNIDYDELYDRIAILCTREFSKLNSASTKIMTPNGYTTMGEIVVGDSVINRYGEEKIVKWKSAPQRPKMYRMVLSDGSWQDVGEDHLNIVWMYRRKNREKVLTTKELLDRPLFKELDRKNTQSPKREYLYGIPLVDPINMDEKEQEIHPYAMGYALANGYMRNGKISCHTGDFKEIAKYMDREGFRVTKGVSPINTLACSFNINNKNMFKNYRHLGGSRDKYIPDEYKYGSIEQRIELLRGMMDGDGTTGGITAGRRSITYDTFSKQLAEDVVFVVRSLGGISYTREYHQDEVTTAYSVVVNIKMNPFKLKRKADSWKPTKKTNRAIVSLEEVPCTEDGYCIGIDSEDESYLTGDGLIVTHNSSLVVYMFLYMAYEGNIPGFGKVSYGIYIGDSMDNNVKSTMKTIKKVFIESKYLRSKFEDTLLNLDFVEFVRNPRTKKEIEQLQEHLDAGGKLNEAPGRMKRTFSLKGIGAAVGGKGSREGLSRPDFNVFDDLVKGKTEASSKTVMKSIEHTIESDVLPGLNNNKNFALIIGTPYNKTDPVYRRIEEGSWLPVVFPRGIVMRDGKSFPMEEDTKEEEFCPVWDDRHSYKNCRRDYRKAMLAKKAGNKEPMRDLVQEHYLRISSSEDRMISDLMMPTYSRTVFERNMDQYKVVITTDLTTSEDEGCLSAIIAWAVNDNMDWFLQDISLRQLSIEEQYTVIFNMARYYKKTTGKSVLVGVEVDGNQKAHIQGLKERQIRLGEYFDFARQKGSKFGSEGILTRLEGGTKHWRLKMMVPWFQNKKVHFPEELKTNNDMIELYEELRSTTYDSINSKFKDGIDAVSQCNFIEVHYPAPSVRKRVMSASEAEDERFMDRMLKNEQPEIDAF
ncbi:MAG: LAGLIDADG family homing endonuclease, partial [Candidatus Thorarchaeota archaeon]